MSVNIRAVKYVAGGAVIAAFAGVGLLAASAGTPDGVLPEGVHVAGMDWSNKTLASARAELEGWSEARLKEPLTLALPEKTGIKHKWTLTRAELGAHIDSDATLNLATGAREKLSLVGRVVSYFSKPKPVEIEPQWKIDLTAIKSFLAKRVAPRVARPPQGARFLATKDSFQIVPERLGAELDVESAIKSIADRIPAMSAEPVELPVRTAKARVVSEDLKGIEGEVSRFSTHYGERGNRRRNIETACSKINGTVLKPGDIFSYNKIVGPRDEDSGFKMAPVIVKGRLVPGMGGGVCQTSSTLYNAVLMADLKIVERNHHAFPVHYLPAGRDATVAYGDKDFKFQNSTDSPIAVAADGTDGRVLMRIFGKKAPGREVRIERTNLSSWGPDVEVVHDSDLPAGRRVVEKGQEGHAGHRVTVWREVYVNGQRVKRETMSHDFYESFPRIVHMGTRPVAPKRSPAPPSTPNPAIPSPPPANPGISPHPPA